MHDSIEPQDTMIVEPCINGDLSFRQDVLSITQEFCESCHTGNDAGDGIQITNYEEIKSIGQDGSLLGSINWESGYSAMPKNRPKIDSCKIEIIKAWIDEDFPNN